MEDKALIIDLAADTNDDSLQVYGALEFSIADGYSNALFSFGSKPQPLTVYVVGEGDLKDNNGVSYGKSYTHAGGIWNGPTKVVGKVNCKVIVTDFKYTFDYIDLSMAKIDPNMLYYNINSIKNRHTLALKSCSLTKSLDVSKLQSYIYLIWFSSIENGNIVGKFTDLSAPIYRINLAKEPLVDAVSLIGKSNIIRFSVPLSGNFKYLADTSISSNNGSTYLHGVAGNVNNNTWTTGSIEEFVTRAIANGKTSGSVNLEYVRNFKNLKYQGYPLSDHSELQNTPSTVFSWNGQGNITWR